MSANDDTHECPSPGCGKRVPFDRFACATHWHTLPEELRKLLWRAWRSSDLGEHAAVRAECVAYLERQAAA